MPKSEVSSSYCTMLELNMDSMSGVKSCTRSTCCGMVCPGDPLLSTFATTLPVFDRLWLCYPVSVGPRPACECETILVSS